MKNSYQIFDDYSTIVSEAKYASFHGKGQMLTAKPML